MRLVIVLLLSLWIGGVALGQQFEVASVKPSRAAENMPEGQVRAQDMMYESMPAGFAPLKGATLAAHNRTLAQLIAMAFKTRPSLVKGESWIAELRYDVDAKLPEGASAKDVNLMLQHLLVERFGLKTHFETKSSGGFALLVAKDGPKLTPAPERVGPIDKEEIARMNREGAERSRQRMDELAKSGQLRRYSSWGSNQATGAQIAEGVSRMIKAPVVDETGLTGKYAVLIEMMGGEPEDTDEYRMSLALAKLGLKLESKKTDVTTVVVDAASKAPTEN